MYGTGRLPGIEAGATNRLEGTIWRGSPETLAFEIVKIGGAAETATPLPLGSIVVEASEGGTFAPLAASAIIATAAELPGARIGVVSEEYAKTGTTAEIEGDEEGQTTTEKTYEKVLIGIRGSVSRSRLVVGGTAYDELTEAQQLNLCRQLNAWGIIPVDVEQC